ncbi:hypothetical protein ACFL54_03055 [Planctomycetota bacterium]
MAEEVSPQEKFKSLTVEFLEKTTLGDEENAARIKPLINNEYWNMILQHMGELIPQPPFPKNLEFSKREILMLSFGLVGYGVFDWEGGMETTVTRDSKPSTRYQVQLVPNALNEEFRNVLNYDLHLNVKTRKFRINKQMELTVQYIRDISEQVEQEIRKHLNSEDTDEVLILNGEYDSRIRPIIEMEKQIKERGISRKEDITRFAQMKEEVDELRRRRETVLNRYSEGKFILERLKLLEVGYGKILELHSADLNTDRELKKANRKVTRIDVITAMKEELKHLKMLVNMTAQMCRLVPMSVPMTNVSLVTPVMLADALDQIVDFDPEIFNNRLVKREGQPKLLLVPGLGNGMYDWSKNRLIVPTMSQRNVMENIATALVMYRLDVDQHYNDRRLINSYKNDIKANREIRSIRRLRQSMVDDYSSWVTKEASGFAVMEKEVREWFEFNIGPKKNNVIIPRDLRGLSLKEVNSLIAQANKDSRNAGALYHLGVLNALKEEFKTAAEIFAKTISVDPDYVDAYYSGGICFQKVKDKRGVDFLTEFVKRAPQSWWSKKAQEMVSKSN